jgi:hypothetical protein
MNTHMVLTHFKLAIPQADYKCLCEQIAGQIAAVPGLVWKAWVFNEARNEAGGIYLFESANAVEAFLDGPIVTDLENHPALTDLRVKTFDVLDVPSKVTRFYSAEAVGA